MEEIKDRLKHLIASADNGRMLREGIKTVILGKPNVGKSSLMNALMGENRAIVTDIPGTTRDTIEESITIKNIPIILTDTAGIHATDDIIEQIGIEKSKESFNRSDLIIFVVDGSRTLEKEDREIIDHIGDRKVIVLLNKQDKGSVTTASEISELIPQAVILESALLEGKGVEDLANAVEEMVYGGQVSQSENLLVTNVRHKNLLDEGERCMVDALGMAEMRQPLEFIEIDVNRCEMR